MECTRASGNRKKLRIKIYWNFQDDPTSKLTSFEVLHLRLQYFSKNTIYINQLMRMSTRDDKYSHISANGNVKIYNLSTKRMLILYFLQGQYLLLIIQQEACFFIDFKTEEREVTFAQRLSHTELSHKYLHLFQDMADNLQFQWCCVSCLMTCYAF